MSNPKLLASEYVMMDSVLQFGPHEGKTVADAIDADWNYVADLVKKWSFIKVDELVRDYIHGYATEGEVSRERVLMRDRPKKTKATSANIIEDLLSKLLPAKGIVTVNTWVHFGPHKGRQIGVILDIDRQWVKAMVSKWPYDRVDGLLKRFIG